MTQRASLYVSDGSDGSPINPADVSNHLDTSLSLTHWGPLPLEKWTEIPSPVENCTQSFVPTENDEKYILTAKYHVICSFPIEFSDLKKIEFKFPAKEIMRMSIPIESQSFIFNPTVWRNPTGSARRGCTWKLDQMFLSLLIVAIYYLTATDSKDVWLSLYLLN